MASTCLRAKTTKDGRTTWGVYYRCGGRAYPQKYAGSFATRELAEARMHFVSELIAKGKDPAVELRRLAEQSLVSLPKLPPRPVEVAPAPPDGHTVYVARERAGHVLYVGITTREIRRLMQHGRNAPWWRLADTIELFHFDTRAEAQVRERELVAALRPAFNVALKPRLVAARPSTEETA